MAEFAAEEDWSLQAIVKESSGDFAKFVGLDHMDTFFESSGNIHQQQFDRDFFSGFPEFFDMANGFSDELEELYKPFYPVGESLITTQDHVLDFQEKQVENGVEDKEIQYLTEHKSSGTDSAAMIHNPAYTPKYKKRKNQQKRVTVQVYADGLSSDLWAWRKYGQKPIKGSPYPRSYYRCSSSKGCLARKQVEQSCTDPRMFIITYTAEHSHSQPTRRNSLAGTVRQKFPSNKSPVKQEKIIEEASSAAGSPITPQQQEVDFAQARIKQEDKYHDDYINTFSMSSDFVFNDDFFSGLEDFGECFSEPGKCHASEQQFSVRSCS